MNTHLCAVHASIFRSKTLISFLIMVVAQGSLKGLSDKSHYCMSPILTHTTRVIFVNMEVTFLHKTRMLFNSVKRYS